MTRISFFTDTKSTGRITGSCGVVGKGIIDVAQACGASISEFCYPLSDKVSPVIAKENSEYNLFFEELYPRALTSANSVNLVYFNLHFFMNGSIFESADLLIFNSHYLKKCFDHVFRMKLFRDCDTSFKVIPPLSPTSLFPLGYRTFGAEFDAKNLDVSNYLIGHSFRPYKHNNLYTLELLARLHSMAIKNGKRGVRFFVPQISIDSFHKTIEDYNLDKNLYEVLFPLPLLDNRTLRNLMRISDFCLCFDNVIEAFGFYPVESVFELCPVYTNGAGNLRFLLPPNCGIDVLDDLNVHFGTETQKKKALDLISSKIFSSIITGQGKKMCLRGKALIEKFYGKEKFKQSFSDVFAGRFKKKRDLNKFKKNEKCRIELSPYVRLADLKKGQFVTDQGNIQLARNAKISSLLDEVIDTDSIAFINSSIFTVKEFL